MFSNRLCHHDAFQNVTKTVRIVIAGAAPNDRRGILFYASLLGREDIRRLLILISRRNARSPGKAETSSSGSSFCRKLTELTTSPSRLGECRGGSRDHAPGLRPVDKDAVEYTTTSADRLVHIADESVDYVFTDPPFGSNIFLQRYESFS